MSELAMQFLSSFVVCVSGFFIRGEQSKMKVYSFVADSGFPFFLFFTKTYSGVAACVVRIYLFSITAILRMRSLAKVFPSVVECVVVFMVWQFFGGTFQNLFRHFSYAFASYDVTHSVKTMRTAIPMSKPIPLVEIGEVGSGDLGVLSLRKRDDLVGWVERLGHCVSFHAAFRHLVLPKGQLLPAAF